MSNKIKLSPFSFSGNVLVYRIHGKFESSDHTSQLYCDRKLYFYAFWMITIPYIFLSLLILVALCVYLNKVCRGRHMKQDKVEPKQDKLEPKQDRVEPQQAEAAESNTAS